MFLSIVLHMPARSRPSLAAGLVALLTLAGASPSLAHTTDDRIVGPHADAYVSAAKPWAHRGSGRVLRVDGSPRVVALLRFDLRSLPRAIGSAQLTLFPKTSARGGVAVRGLGSSAFKERGVTWANRPRAGAVIARTARIRRHRPITVDVTRALAPDGTLSLALTRRASQAVAFYSREHPTRGPRLSVHVDGQAITPGLGAPFRPTVASPPAPTPSFTLDSSFDRPSRSDPDDYRQRVDFNVVCTVARIAPDDPIVFPGQPGASHMHVFIGNTSVDAFSTQASLEAGGTNCQLDRDKASYWMPELRDENGNAVTPFHARAYYRAATLGTVAHYPYGLRMIAGDGTATAPQSKSIAGWQCRNVSPDTVAIGKQATIPTCARNDVLEASVVFPNCWDGVNLDSPDHKSHMAYGNGDDCDAAHPVRLGALTIAYRYPPGTTNSRATLSAGGSGLTLHADFWNAWHQPTLDALVDRCINAGVHCGDVSPSHFPGPIPPP
jgi:hypothetical protein